MSCQKERLFPPQLTCQWSRNMIQVMSCRFQQCLGTFTILLVEGTSATGHFRHLSYHVFRVRNLGNTKGIRLIFFSKRWKFQIDFKNAAKIWGNVFCFSDNRFWIGIVKLFQLRTGYFSSVPNVLTRSPRIWHVNKRDFF